VIISDLRNIKPAVTELSETLKKLTIIIINYNTKELLKKCLDVLNVKNIPENYNIIVIDNNSPDGSADMAQKIPGHFEVVRLKENKGFPCAANTGIKKSLSEYYMILNSDTEVKQIQLAEMLKFMEDNPEIGAMTPFQFNNKNESQLAWGRFPTFTSEIGRKILQDALDKGKKWAHRKLSKLKEPFFVHWVAGSTMFLRNAALKEAGLFDEKFFIFFEDIDLCTRIRQSGWKIAVFPGIRAIHHRGESAKTDSMNASLHYRRSQLYFWKKHHNRLSFSMMKAFLLSKFRIKKYMLSIKILMLKSGRTKLRREREDLLKFIKLIKTYK
jgi:GT2 family glycosyltransferase